MMRGLALAGTNWHQMRPNIEQSGRSSRFRANLSSVCSWHPWSVLLGTFDE